MTSGVLPAPPPGRAGWPWRASAPERPPAGGQVPRISVIVPSLNQGGFLEEALRSVLLQDYPALELIVIDGGSGDETREILQRYRPWLTACVVEPDRGQSDAINKGFSRCTGDLITFIGADDMLLEGALAHVAGLWPSLAQAGAVVGGFVSLDERSRVDPAVHPARIPDGGPLDLSALEPGTWRLHQVSTFFTRAALDAVGRHVPEDLPYSMDRELLFRVARQFPIVTTPRALGAFRLHPSSKSVASILPGAREFAWLFLTQPATTPAAGRQRAKNARHYLHAGYLRGARAQHGVARAVLMAVCRVIASSGSFLSTRFILTCLDAVRLERWFRLAQPQVDRPNDGRPESGPA